jgi:Bacterial extracellular solute-binding protein
VRSSSWWKDPEPNSAERSCPAILGLRHAERAQPLDEHLRLVGSELDAVAAGRASCDLLVVAAAVDLLGEDVEQPLHLDDLPVRAAREIGRVLEPRALVLADQLHALGQAGRLGIRRNGRARRGQVRHESRKRTRRAAGGRHRPSLFGARWYDEQGRPTLDTPELRAAIDHYVDLIRRAGPPESPTMDFMDCMACYAAGRAAMTIEPANEASILYDGGGPIADATKTALIPAGPLGTRHARLYCPPYAIPSLSQSKEAAWELAKFLCAPEQVLEDAQNSGFVEVSRNSVLANPAFVDRFRPELIETTVATRAFARGERPVTGFGMQVGDIIGDEIVRVLTGELTAQEAMRVAEQRVGALGSP